MHEERQCCFENTLWLVKHNTPSPQDEYLKSCLHKTVVFQYRFGHHPEELEQFDGQKAWIHGVDSEGKFILYFNEASESAKLRGEERAEGLDGEDFQFLEEIHKKHKEFIEGLGDEIAEF